MRDSRPRFVRADLVALPGGATAVTTPRGTVLRVDLDEAQLVAVLKSCDGHTPLSAVVDGQPRSDDLLELLEKLLAEGCLAEPGSVSEDWARFAGLGAVPRPDVLVVGADRVAEMAVEMLAGAAASQFATVRRDTAWLDDPDAHLPGETIVLVLLDRLDHEFLARVGRACAQRGVRWTYFAVDAHRGWFGPHVHPDGGPDIDDLYARALAAARDPDLFRARQTQTAHRDRYLPPAAEITWMLSAFLIDVARWAAGAKALGHWHEVELDPVGMRIERHPVLPFPDRAGAVGPVVGADPLAMLVDRRTGIITDLIDVDHRTRFPVALTTVQALGCDVSRVRPWCNDPVGGGSGFDGVESARGAAVGELIERYCGNIVRPDLLTYDSYDRLRASGQYAVDPDTLALFSPSQYAAPGFPFVPLTRDRPIHWVRGRSLTQDVPAWLPASLVYVNWYNTAQGNGAPTNGTCFAGIAAGTGVRASVASGLLEVIERHATMVWWLNREPLPGVRPTAALRALWTDGEAGPFRRWLIHLDNEFAIPVMAGVVEDTERSVLTIGFAARADPEKAARKAWAEALVLQDIGRDLLLPRSAYAAAIDRGRLPDQGLKPWREDRRYLDDYRPDFRDVTSLICQSQLHLDPRAQDLVQPWVDVEARRSMSDIDPLDDDGLSAVQAAVEARGCEIFYADITTPDVAATGLRVTRTLVPGLVGNFPAAFPFLGGRVIQDSAVHLGWRATAMAEDDLTQIPMPHA